jgi:hypothetical protein
MYLPNPIAIGAIKAGTYLAVGALVRVRAATPGHPLLRPLTFSLARTLLGWVVGVPVLLIAVTAFTELSNVGVVAVLALPRFILSAALIQHFFHPRGGWRETAAWGLLSVTTATTIDLLLLRTFQEVEWLRVGWC